MVSSDGVTPVAGRREASGLAVAGRGFLEAELAFAREAKVSLRRARRFPNRERSTMFALAISMFGVLTRVTMIYFM
jgi:hypothetical protein